MFKKLLSNLPYNPSLIGQVSFYAKRMHAEESVRRLGLGFVMLAMFVQMFAVMSPPEPGLAASSNDIIHGGFKTHAQANQHCRNNTSDFRNILSYYGVSCDTLAKASTRWIKSTDHNKQIHSMGRNPKGQYITKNGRSKPTNEHSVKINGKTYYMRHLWAWDSGAYSSYEVLEMKNNRGQTIMILYNCGNIATIGEYKPPAPIVPAPIVPKPAPKPEVRGQADCSSLTAVKLGSQKYRFTATTTGQHYTPQKYDFNFGNSKSRTVSSTSKSTSVDYTYPTYGSYTAKVTITARLNHSAGAKTTTFDCQTRINIADPDVCPNVPGIQTSTSQCDVCPSVPGVQSSLDECKPCEDSEDDDDTTACLVLNKTASNLTQDIENADGTMANGGDVIRYTLSVSNTGQVPISGYVVEENMADVLEYADIEDFHGGELVDEFVVEWPGTDIAAGGTITKELTIKVKDPIPQTPVSTSYAGTYDLTMTNVYGDVVSITLPPSITKTTEQVVQQLPNTGPGTSLTVAVGFTVFVGYFFARSRLYAKELDIVRTDYATTGGGS